MTIEDHNEAKLLAERKERRRAYMREYVRKWSAANPEKVREFYRKINKARKVKEDGAFDIKFVAERERERQRHQQMKAAQLRRSIMRSGEYQDTIWLGDIMRDLVRYVADHVPVDDQHDEVESAFLDFCWSPVSSAGLTRHFKLN